MADDALIVLTRPQFENLMETQGLSNTVNGILEIANEELDLGGVPLTRESLRNGTHPILDQLDRYKGISPEKIPKPCDEYLEGRSSRKQENGKDSIKNFHCKM